MVTMPEFFPDVTEKKLWVFPNEDEIRPVFHLRTHFAFSFFEQSVKTPQTGKLLRVRHHFKNKSD